MFFLFVLFFTQPPTTTTAQISSILEKLGLTESVGLTRKELDYLKSLGSRELEKLKRVVDLIKEAKISKITEQAQRNTDQSYLSNQSQTPNPNQYNIPQSFPISQNQQYPYQQTPYQQFTQNPNYLQQPQFQQPTILQQPFQQPNNNSYLNSLLGRTQQSDALQRYQNQTAPEHYASQAVFVRETPSKETSFLNNEIEMEEIVESNKYDASVDKISPPQGCPANIPAFCKENHGVDISGTCSEKRISSPPVSKKLARDLECVCALLGKRIQSLSVYRSQAQQNCVNPVVKNSEHTHGTAIDFSYRGISLQEQMKVFFYFKRNGYRHGCYCNTTHVHFGHTPGLKNYGNCCPNTLNAVLRSDLKN